MIGSIKAADHMAGRGGGWHGGQEVPSTGPRRSKVLHGSREKV
jgi:hypothetical protein